MDSHAAIKRRPPSTPRRAKVSWTVLDLVTLIEGVLIGVGGVYVTTQSAAVTIIAAAAAGPVYKSPRTAVDGGLPISCTVRTWMLAALCRRDATFRVVRLPEE